MKQSLQPPGSTSRCTTRSQALSSDTILNPKINRSQSTSDHTNRWTLQPSHRIATAPTKVILATLFLLTNPVLANEQRITIKSPGSATPAPNWTFGLSIRNNPTAGGSTNATVPAGTSDAGVAQAAAQTITAEMGIFNDLEINLFDVHEQLLFSQSVMLEDTATQQELDFALMQAFEQFPTGLGGWMMLPEPEGFFFGNDLNEAMTGGGIEVLLQPGSEQSQMHLLLEGEDLRRSPSIASPNPCSKESLSAIGQKRSRKKSSIFPPFVRLSKTYFTSG